MIVLDTNVVSEVMKPDPASSVIAWLDLHSAEEFFLTSTSLAELLVGIEILPHGKPRMLLAEILRQSMKRFFGSRILPVDEVSAQAFAALFARARSKGVTVTVGDCQIAAIAEVHGFAVATRDTTPFLAMGLPVIDPWNL